jgi:hypothetical protein
MGPCIVRIFQYISNKMQRYTVYYIWKLLYMFRVVFPPIIRSAYNSIYSICYLSHRYCYLPLAASCCILLDKYWNILKMLELDSSVQNEIKWEIGRKSVCAANLRHCASL